MWILACGAESLTPTRTQAARSWARRQMTGRKVAVGVRGPPCGRLRALRVRQAVPWRAAGPGHGTAAFTGKGSSPLPTATATSVRRGELAASLVWLD